MPLTTVQTQQLIGVADGLAQAARLLQDPAFLQALNALTDSPKARQTAKVDPAAYLRAAGVPLSKTAVVTYTEVVSDDVVTTGASARRVTITVCDSIFLLNMKIVSVCQTYDSETGWHSSIVLF